MPYLRALVLLVTLAAAPAFAEVASPALTRLLAALGSHGASATDEHTWHPHLGGATATCMSDGILSLTAAMLGGLPGAWGK